MSETKDNKIEKMTIIQNDAMKLFKKKSDEYNNSVEIYGTLGVILRVAEKVQHFTSDSSNEFILTNSELLIETLLDLNNYSAMAIMSINEKNIGNINNGNNNVRTLNEIPQNLSNENFHEYLTYY